MYLAYLEEDFNQMYEHQIGLNLSATFFLRKMQNETNENHEFYSSNFLK